MDPKIVKVKRGVNLIIGDYRYKKDGKHGGKQHWRCVVILGSWDLVSWESQKNCS